MRTFEQELWCSGLQHVAGVDEAGRGPLAGPVAAAAVIVSPSMTFSSRIADSKKLTAAQRDAAYAEITRQCVWSVALIEAAQIDRSNILHASLAAMAQAVAALPLPAQWVLIDGPQLPDIPVPATAIVGGDSRSISIASASIIAKVTRDRIMRDFDCVYPQYGFAQHKGYGTKRHLDALRTYGPCPLHRRSFAPVAACL